MSSKMSQEACSKVSVWGTALVSLSFSMADTLSKPRGKKLTVRFVLVQNSEFTRGETVERSNYGNSSFQILKLK